MGIFEILGPALVLLVMSVFMSVKWVAALFATIVVWPVRAATGRWPVVAYEITGLDRMTLVCRVDGREAADELARRWAADIKRAGELVPFDGIRDPAGA